ncbi:hypothetical protein QEV83_09200 [Methylocapsa sp. D3K7]|uniref:hypothetical protein n=1 Tax=Methylocapsa sp. D3K7 TaxID=3041435 RepID=UPI00244E8475|nr:hypothetical protein [Methylocapsa sp. D3K7]WGJ16388.1 hypothetical protein QEV83_09200 [Methylocapsa sp. D3K7]
MVEAVPFWLASLITPIIVILGLSAVRLVAGLSQSLGLDIIATLIIFDAAVMYQHQEFENYIVYGPFKPITQYIYVAMVIAGCFFLMILLINERKLSEYNEASLEQLKLNSCKTQPCALKSGIQIARFPWISYSLSLVIVVVYIFGSVTPFIYGRLGSVTTFIYG